MSGDGRKTSTDPARPPAPVHYVPMATTQQAHLYYQRQIQAMANAAGPAATTRLQPTLAPNPSSYVPQTHSTSATYQYPPPTFSQPPSNSLPNRPMNDYSAENFGTLLASAVKTSMAAEFQTVHAEFQRVHARIDKFATDVKEIVNNLHSQTHSQVLQSLEASQKAYKLLHADVKITKDRADRSEKLLYAGLDRNDKESLVSRLENVQYNFGELAERLKDPQAHDLRNVIAPPTVPAAPRTERVLSPVQRIYVDKPAFTTPRSHRSQLSYADVANDTEDLCLDLPSLPSPVSIAIPSKTLGVSNDARSPSEPRHENLLLLEHILTEEELNDLLPKPEPQRCFDWMKTMFVAKPDNVVEQSTLWKLYNAAFLPHEKQHPLLGVSDFLSSVIAAFPNATKAAVVDGLDRYIIWGIERRKIAVPVDLSCHCGRLALEHTLTKEELDVLISKPEPLRCHDWLKAIFVANSDGEVNHVDFCDIYHDTFNPYADRYSLLPDVDVMKNVSAVFPEARLVTFDGNPQRCVMRGINRKQDLVLCFKCWHSSGRPSAIPREPSPKATDFDCSRSFPAVIVSAAIDNDLDTSLVIEGGGDASSIVMGQAMNSVPALNDAEDDEVGVDTDDAMAAEDPDTPMTVNDNVPPVTVYDTGGLSPDPIGTWSDHEGFDNEEQIDELDDEPVLSTAVEHPSMESSLKTIESSIVALRKEIESSPGNSQGPHGLPSPATTPSGPISPVSDHPSPTPVPPATTPGCPPPPDEVVVGVNSSPIQIEPIPRLATGTPSAPIPSLTLSTPKSKLDLLATSITTSQRLDLRFIAPIPSPRPASSTGYASSTICSPPPRFKASWRTSSHVSSGPRTPGAKLRISDPVPDSEDESSELAANHMVAVEPPERSPEAPISPEVPNPESTMSKRPEEPPFSPVVPDPEPIMLEEMPLSPAVPDPEPYTSTSTHAPIPALALFLPVSRPGSSPPPTRTATDDTCRQSPPLLLQVPPVTQSPSRRNPSLSSPSMLRTPSKPPPRTIFSPNWKGTGTSVKRSPAKATLITRSPRGGPIVIASSPVYISSSAPSPLSQLSPSDDSDSSDAPKVVRKKKTRSIVKTEAGGSGSAPARRLNLQELVKAKAQQSGAITRVKKRKAPTLTEMQPPLKRAKQKLEGKEKKRNKSEANQGTKGEKKNPRLRPRPDCKWPPISSDNHSDHQFIECEKCKRWYHYGCVGATVAHDSKFFSCPPCQAGSTNLMDSPLDATICARPDCKQATRQPDEYFMTAIIGRQTRMQGGLGRTYKWLVKWDGYSIKDCTWEEQDGMSDPTIFIEDFYRVAAKEGYDPDEDPQATILLREAIQGGWKDPDA